MPEEVQQDVQVDAPVEVPVEVAPEVVVPEAPAEAVDAPRVPEDIAPNSSHVW